jgi:hypothetical protein
VLPEGEAGESQPAGEDIDLEEDESFDAEFDEETGDEVDL